MELLVRAKKAWNVFTNRDPTFNSWDNGPTYGIRPDRIHLKSGNERSIIAAILTRIALDVSLFNFRHVQLDENDRFMSVISSGLDECLNVQANIDQTGMSFIQDITISMLDEGCVGVIPVDTFWSKNEDSLAYTIRTMRTGQITQWKPRHVQLKVYNDQTGVKQDVEMPKENVGIFENPLYPIMNEPNSTLKRLIRKLNLLDAVDEQTNSGKLDLIIQLPYVVRSDLRKNQAELRRKAIEDQLKGSKYGIAYADGTEKITQLNRPAENNLLTQIEYLTNMLYSQLGVSESILDGTANEDTLANYYSRTIVPVVKTISNEMHRTFLSAKNRKDHQAIRAFRNPFDSVAASKLPEMADRFTRNEIVSSNEVRQVIGLQASLDPRADELLNKNMKPLGNQERSQTIKMGGKNEKY